MKDLKPHPQAEILRAIADGKTVQIRHEDDDAWWEPTDALGYINSDKHKFRIKPETITINGIEVPAPVREPLNRGQTYWLVRCCSTVGSESQTWHGAPQDFLWLKNGLIHLHHKNADAHTEALLSFTRSDK